MRILPLIAAVGLAACNTSSGATRTQDGTTAQNVAYRTAAVMAIPTDSFTQRIDQARILGDPAAKVWMVMASDFQCPYCKQWHDASFATLRHDYVESGKVRMAFLNFPLRQHPNAFPAAEAAMCAGAQGKFWPMHDALFAGQQRWEPLPNPRPVFDSLAATVGIDTTAMSACVTAQRPDAMILADEDRAERAGVKSTPTIIIGTQVLAGAQPTAVYRHILDSALAVVK